MLSRGWRDGHISGFLELALANFNDTPLQINICQRQIQRLSDAQASGAKQANEVRNDHRPQTARRAKLPSGRHDPRHLLTAVDVRSWTGPARHAIAMNQTSPRVKITQVTAELAQNAK